MSLTRLFLFCSLKRQYSPLRERFRIYSVETVSEVSEKSNVKIVTNVKRKNGSKCKAN